MRILTENECQLLTGGITQNEQLLYMFGPIVGLCCAVLTFASLELMYTASTASILALALTFLVTLDRKG